MYKKNQSLHEKDHCSSTLTSRWRAAAQNKTAAFFLYSCEEMKAPEPESIPGAKRRKQTGEKNNDSGG